MPIWNNFTKKVSESTGKAVQQANIIAETTKLNSLISQEEKTLDSIYKKIGKLYVFLHSADYETDFTELMNSVSESKQKITQYQTQIQTVKGIIACPKCGTEMTKGVAFCSTCGSAIPKEEKIDENTYVKCGNCGEMVDPEMRFCSSCGNALAKSTSAARICSNCGHTLEDDADFCTECGSKYINKTE